MKKLLFTILILLLAFPCYATSPYIHYKMNVTAGGTTTEPDDGTGGFNATCTDWLSSRDTTGKVGTAYLWTGYQAYFLYNYDAVSSMSTDTAGSFSIWFQLSSKSYDSYLFTMDNTAASDMIAVKYLTATDSIYVEAFVSSTKNWEITYDASGLSLNTWYMLTVVQDGVSPKLYIDDTDVTNLTTSTDTTTWIADLPTNADRLFIGKYWRAWYYFGKTDEFRYYRIALSSSDVDLLYNSGSGTDADDPGIGGPEPPPPPGVTVIGSYMDGVTIN